MQSIAKILSRIAPWGRGELSEDEVGDIVKPFAKTFQRYRLSLRTLSGLVLLYLSNPIEAAPVTVELWRHESADAELTANLAAIERFNQLQNDWHIRVETLPQGSYTESITAAALAGQLPCIFDADQPVIPNFAWAGHLMPLRQLLAPDQLEQLLPGAIGEYKGTAYSVGQFDVALALFARRSELERRGIRIASMEQPYTHEELARILAEAKRAEPDTFPIDINSRFDGEWISYGYGPWLQSGGADLIDRDSMTRADGILNSAAAVEVARWYQWLFDQRLAERQPVDDQAFLQGRALFHYTGSWYAQQYFDRFADDLVIMPPPDFGNGPVVGSGSWHWTVNSACEHPDAARDFLAFLLSDVEIAAMSEATGMIPVTEEAARLSERYRPGGEWRTFFDYVQQYAMPRPETPAYPKISAAFEKAMLDIKFGRDAQQALDVAVDSIEYDIHRNRGYGFFEESP